MPRPAPLSEHVRTIQLPVAGCAVADGTFCLMYGWGDTKGTILFSILFCSLLLFHFCSISILFYSNAFCIIFYSLFHFLFYSIFYSILFLCILYYIIFCSISYSILLSYFCSVLFYCVLYYILFYVPFSFLFNSLLSICIHSILLFFNTTISISILFYCILYSILFSVQFMSLFFGIYKKKLFYVQYSISIVFCSFLFSSLIGLLSCIKKTFVL